MDGGVTDKAAGGAANKAASGAADEADGRVFAYAFPLDAADIVVDGGWGGTGDGECDGGTTGDGDCDGGAEMSSLATGHNKYISQRTGEWDSK